MPLHVRLAECEDPARAASERGLAVEEVVLPGRLLFVVVDELLLVDRAWLAEHRKKKRGGRW